MKIKLKRLFAILFLLICLVQVIPSASASPHATNSIDWWVVSSGGGQATAGNILIQDTIGQPLVGVATAPGNQISSGFWFIEQIENQLHLPLIIR